MNNLTTPDVLIVGCGPSGMAAALELAKDEKKQILLVDRDDGAGGLPRFCDHPGFGWEYTRRLHSGPGFVRHMLNKIRQQKNIHVLLRATVTAIDSGPRVSLVSVEHGMMHVTPKAVLVATGVRESTRAARSICGHRPVDAFINTGQLQQMNMRGVTTLKGRRTLIVGTELVSFSALLSAREAGIHVAGMVEKETQIQSWPILKTGVETLLRVPVYTGTSIEFVEGNSRSVKAVNLRQDSKSISVHCDLIIMTGDWQADSFMAESSGLQVETVTRAISTDQHFRTENAGVFATGNVTHPVATTGQCANEGKKAGAVINNYLAGNIVEERAVVSLSARNADLMLSPQELDTGNLPETLMIRTTRSYQSVRLTVSQNGEPIHEFIVKGLKAFTGKKISLSEITHKLDLTRDMDFSLEA